MSQQVPENHVQSKADPTQDLSGPLEAILHPHQEWIQIGTTRVKVRTYSLRISVNGDIQQNQLANYLATKIIEYMFPKSKIEEVLKQAAESADPSYVLKQRMEAKRHFVASKTSGEGGEVLLYILATYILGLPQIASKMRLKTNTSQHVHGIDALHVDTAMPGNPRLFWGESKLHKTRSHALTECVTTLATYLKDENRRTQDITLLRSDLSSCDSATLELIQAFLDPEDPSSLKLEHCGIGLFGHDCATYNHSRGEILTESAHHSKLDRTATSLHNLLAQQIESNDLAPYEIMLFHLPFKSVNDFRAAFLDAI